MSRRSSVILRSKAKIFFDTSKNDEIPSFHTTAVHHFIDIINPAKVTNKKSINIVSVCSD